MRIKILFLTILTLFYVISFNAYAQKYNRQKVTLSSAIAPITVNLKSLSVPSPIVERGIEENKEMGPFKSLEEFEMEQKDK